MSIMSKPGLTWRALWLPKRGNSADEYEDAFAGDAQLARFAVADGASESSFASLWAKLLVDGFVHPATRSDQQSSWLDPLRARWSAQVDHQQLAWYAEDKRDLGAYATFLGVLVRRTERTADGAWSALAVGDSCIFQVRKETLIQAFPLRHSDSFGNQPSLIASRLEGAPQPRLRREAGRWLAGDRLLLMTDALAQWFLKQTERGKKPWQALERILAEPSNDPSRAAWIEQLRDRDGMRNDDVTVITVHL
jgi:hypothetical protein